ncbi:hypothetical protein [Rickettsia asembonensis]|uniref:Uncharacterized protein n=1 Tax=Rickettsia asembonensis TaxID=1068590 RepID=A0A0C2RCH3_9RICK|nr:hypothetical protein [Rickettsia asembonensis]KIJ88490.1 hypothetical protein SB78_05450 [Rickettsia asembonensis]WCR56096.1 MAG: Internalin H [Rickettsia asembonensis]
MEEDNNAVSIPDKKLSRIIHRILKKNDAESITKEEIASITNINVFDQGVKDLTGLEYATNLEKLIISYNAIDSLEPLKSCMKLKSLIAVCLTTASINNLPTNLEELDISNLSLTGTDGFTSLSSLTNIKTLQVSNTILNDIDFVSLTVNLSKIEANNCQVTNLKPLQALLDKRLQDSSYSFETQTVLLDKGTVGQTTALALHKPDGESPNITWNTADSYDNEKEQLTWENSGDNHSLSWSYSAENNEVVFSGEISQFATEI